MEQEMIPFAKPVRVGNEAQYIEQVLHSSSMSGDGAFTKKCHQFLSQRVKTSGVLLTHSCTAALEMGVILADLKPGDEVILPSYTFVSSANAIVMRGGIPVFVDIRPDTLNLDEKKIASAITKKTKAIMPVHYAGVACEMDMILQLAKTHGLFVIEDAAQGYGAKYKEIELGTLGDFGALSFHQTKNIISGEGGALYVKESQMFKRAEIIREKGTDRSQFLRGEIDKYCWRDVGSSYLPGDIIAAFLLAQLEQADVVLEHRLKVWNRYHTELSDLAQQVGVRTPQIPKECQHNAHIYYLIFPTDELAGQFTAAMKESRIQASYHYVPLHNSPGGERFGRSVGSMTITEEVSSRLVRLPLWHGLENHQGRVIDAVKKFLLKL